MWLIEMSTESLKMFINKKTLVGTLVLYIILFFKSSYHTLELLEFKYEVVNVYCWLRLGGIYISKQYTIDQSNFI